MSTVIAKPNPYAGLLAAAAAQPTKGGAVARYQRRLDTAGSRQVALLDVSSSMAEQAGSRTKIEILRDALANAPPALLIAFSSTPIEIASAADLPAPNGGTALHLALDLAGVERPWRTLVISDGQPDSEDAALAAARRITGSIDVIYCGPDSDTNARAFLMRLARTGGGRYVGHDLRHNPLALAPAVRLMLTIGSGR